MDIYDRVYEKELARLHFAKALGEHRMSEEQMVERATWAAEAAVNDSFDSHIRKEIRNISHYGHD